MGVLSSSVPRMSFCGKRVLPTMLIWRILARPPSLMVTLILTRLPVSSSTLGVDLHAVLAAAEVLIGEVLGDVLEYRAVEGLAGCEPYPAQRLLQVLGLYVLVAGDLEALDRGPLEHHHHQRVAVAAQLHVAEEAGRIQRGDGLAHPRRSQPIADVDRQVVVDRAFRDALQALDADVADGEVGRRRGGGLRRRPDRRRARRPGRGGGGRRRAGGGWRRAGGGRRLAGALGGAARGRLRQRRRAARQQRERAQSDRNPPP